MKTLSGQTIWSIDRITERSQTRVELTSLLRFKDHWYCGFREGQCHWNHPSGCGRIIRSPDGKHWESVLLLQWDSGDVREPKLSITAEGKLLVNTSVYFVSKEPRDEPPSTQSGIDTPPEAKRAGHPKHYQLDPIGTVLNMPYTDREDLTTQQSVTWSSADGVHWETAFACPTGVNTWRWDITWHNGMGYSLGQWGKDIRGTLYRTRDGKNWRVLKEDFCPEGKCNEGGFAFGADNTAYCLLRHGSKKVVLGIGQAPYYQNWQWKELQVDWLGNGTFAPSEDVLRVSLGGPQLRYLSNGKLIGAGRGLGPDQEDGRIALFQVDPEKGRLTRFAELEGTSYPGIVEQDASLWVSAVSSDVKKILLFQVPMALV